MNTAEQTVRQIVQINGREPSTLELIDRALPWVSPSVRADLLRVRESVMSLQIANRLHAAALADANAELAHLRCVHQVAA